MYLRLLQSPDNPPASALQGHWLQARAITPGSQALAFPGTLKCKCILSSLFYIGNGLNHETANENELMPQTEVFFYRRIQLNDRSASRLGYSRWRCTMLKLTAFDGVHKRKDSNEFNLVGIVCFLCFLIVALLQGLSRYSSGHRKTWFPLNLFLVWERL